MALAIYFILTIQSCLAGDDDDPATLTVPAHAYGVVRIETQKQVETGLKTEPVQAARFQEEYETSGKIIGIGALMALRERYLLAKAEHRTAMANLTKTKQGLARQLDLYKNGISSQRTLQELEAQKLSDSSAVNAAQVKLTAIASEARLNWGGKLSDWALAESPDKLKSFLSGQAFLLLVTLPANRELPSELTAVQAHRSGQRTDAQPAYLIGKASQIDSGMQGESYYFQLQGEQYRTDMRVSVWVPVSQHDNTGVIVPEQAFVWYMDQVYVYVKEGKDNFLRRAVTDFNPVAGGFFVKTGLNPGEELVTSGAQMLLSEELRRQIPDEDD